MEAELKRQEALANEINDELDQMIDRLYEFQEILENEKLMYGLTPELKHIQKKVNKMLN